MNTKDLYWIPFGNQVYSLTFEQVNELLKISEFSNSDIKLKIRLKNNRELIGTVFDFDGYNPLSPADIYIPIVFKIKTSEKTEELTFLEVESIKVENLNY